MKLSSRAQYAITAMLELVLHDKDSRVTLYTISQKQNISLSYLEQMFARLRQANLVKGRRGPGGGYELAREPAEISIAEIISAVDGIEAPTEKGGSAKQSMTSEAMWNQLSGEIYNFLGGITLAHFMEFGGAKAGAANLQRRVG